MASTIESSQSGKFVEFDEYIDYQLEKTRNSIKWTDILTTLVGISALILGYLFLFQIFDHWIVSGGFGVYTRFILFSTLLIVSATWIVWKVVLPWWKQIHALYAARMIEQHSPGLKSSLLNLIDLRTSGRETSSHIQNALEKRSATELSHIDIEHAIDRRGLLRTSWILLVIVVLCCAYALLSPKPISFLRPLTWADIAPVTKTDIIEVSPGNAEVPARVPVDIRVIVGGEAPDEVAFHYTTQDRTFVNERLLLSAVEDKPNEFQLPFAGENGAGLTQSIEYYITAGDAVSETYRLAVVLAPSATVEEIEYQFPAYTELEPRSQPTPPIDAIEGTQVTLFANTGGVPVTSAVLELLSADTKTTAHEEIPITITDGTQLKATWKLGFRNDGTYAREYRIRCQTAEGLSELDPARHPIVIRPDIPPEVALLDPQGDLERPANAVIPIVFKARDPDFKVSYVTLRVEKDGEELQSYPLFDGDKKVVVDRYRWELETLRLKPGDVLSFYAEARDNKQPYGNRKTSTPLKLTIIEPVTPEEAQQQQQQDEQQQEPELREEQQQAAAENGEEPSDDTTNGNEGDKGKPQQASDEEKASDQTSETEGENSKDETGTSNKENEGNNDTGTDENSSEKKEPGDENSKDPGNENQPQQNEPGEGEQKEGGEKRPLEDDGTDDAEALEKLIDHQKRQSEKKPSTPDQPSEKPEQEPKPNENSTDPKQETKDEPGDNNKPNPQESAQPGEQEGTQGKKQPGDDPKGEDPEQTGKGKGNDAEKSDDPKDAATEKLDPNEKGTPTEEPNKANEKPEEKGPDDPDPKGKGTPDEKPDPNAPRSKEDIEREQDTKPSTVPSKDPKSPDPQEKRNEKPKNPNGAKPEQKPTQKPNTNDTPKGDDPPNPAKGDPNQKSEKPDSGEKGNSQETTEGNPDNKGAGAGEPSDKPGDSKDNPGEKKEGKPGEKDENGTKTDQPKPGEEKSEAGGEVKEGKGEDESGGGAGEGEKGESTEGSGAPPSDTGKGGGSDTPPPGGNAPGMGEGAKANDNPTGAGNSTPEPGNLEDAKEATDLILKKLEEDIQRGEVDDELLKDLGWTESQMEAFADRLRRQIERDSKAQNPEDQLKQRQFEEMLKNMDFNPDVNQRTKKDLPTRNTESFGARRLPIPLEHREAYEAFTREISKRKRK